MTHDSIETALLLALCEAVDGETLAGDPPEQGAAVMPDGRIMAQSIVSAVKHDLKPDDLSTVKLLEKARRGLDDAGWNTVDAEMSVHLDCHADMPAAFVKVTLQPQEEATS